MREFLDELPAAKPPIIRVPGTAIFLNPGDKTTPLALRAVVRHNHTLHEKVVIVSVDTVSIPRIDGSDQFSVKLMGHGLYKVAHVKMRCGYRNRQNIPEALAEARKQGLLDRNLDLEHASYFLSQITIRPTDEPGMRPLAQEAVRDDGPQLREPDRGLPPAQRADRDPGLADPGLGGDVRRGGAGQAVGGRQR